VVPRILEDQLVEILLEHEATAAAGFTKRNIDAYGSKLSFREIAEQIRGRVHEAEIAVLLSNEEAHGLIEYLEQAVPNCGISYRISPVARVGVIK
jgi:hypothetical protein